MSKAIQHVIIATSLLFVVIPAIAQTDIRYEMLVNANIDGYPTDDDVTAIGRYLTAVGDGKLAVPDDIATWITNSISHQGPASAPRLLSAYMHFLREGALAPPFDAGTLTSTRRALLRTIENDLMSRRTPLAEFALLMFTEVGDQQLQQLALSADYSALKAYPWLSGVNWANDWMLWAPFGLNPDRPSFLSSPTYPVVTPNAKAGQLPSVRDFLYRLNLQSPVTASSMNFAALASRLTTLEVGPNNVTLSASDRSAMRQQCGALFTLLSHRASLLLAIPPQDQDARFLGQFSFDISDSCDLDQAISSGGATEVALGLKQAALLKFDEDRDRFVNLGRVLTAQQMRVLALGAYALLTFQHATNGPAVDIPEDQVLNHLSAIRLPRAAIKTRIVKNLSRSDLSSAAGIDLSALARCNPRSVVVSWRHVSLHAGAFVERLKGACSDGSSLSFSTYGTLTPDFVQLMELVPRYFDILDISLGIRALAAFSPQRLENPDDIDLMCQSPVLATGLILADINHPTAPWSYTRDVLLQYWPSSIAWLAPGWRPAPPIIFDHPPNDRSLLSQSEFSDWKTGALAGESNYLHSEAIWRFYHAVFPKVNAMPVSIGTCDPVTYGLNFGHCPNPVRTNRGIYLTDLDNLAKQGNEYIKESASFNDRVCNLPRQPNGRDQFGIALNEDLTEVVTQYVLSNVCSFSYDGKLALTPATRTQLKAILTADPLFLNRFQIDLTNSYADWIDRLTATMASQDPDRAQQTLVFIERHNLLEYLPFDPMPPLRVDPGGANYGQAVRNAATDIMIAPLLRTADGTRLASDLLRMQELAARAPAPSVVSPHISDQFVSDQRAEEARNLAAVNAKADKQIEDAEAAIAQKPDSQWSIGISVGVSGYIGAVLSFSYNGNSLDIPISGPGENVPDFTIPAFNFPGEAAPIAVANDQQNDEQTVPASGSVQNQQAAGAVSMTTADGSEMSMLLGQGEMGTLLNADNETGRILLEQELDDAKPLLSNSQLEAITNALKAPQIPDSIATLIAKESAAASRQGREGGTDTPTSSACSSDSWVICGYSIKNALEEGPKKPEEIVALAGLWGKSFNNRYDQLRRDGGLETTTIDQTTFSSVLSDRLQGMAEDAAMDALLNGYLDELPAIIKFALGPARETIEKTKSRFDSIPAVASDYDELLMMNDEIQTDIAADLEPFLKQNWQQDLEAHLTQDLPKTLP